MGYYRQKEGTVLCEEQKTVPEERLSNSFFDQILQLRLANGAGYLVDDLAALEQDEGGDGPDAKFSGGGGIIIYIHLGDDHLAFEFRSQLINNWPYSLAGPAPRCPKIDQTGKRIADYFTFEFTVGNVDYIVACHLSLLLVDSRRKKMNEKGMNFRWLCDGELYRRPFYLAGQLVTRKN
jgi:hypothetical protein